MGGTIAAHELASGKPLEFAVCQNCNDYDCMGDPAPRNERGWNQNIVKRFAGVMR
jgi:hypothetical protein